MLYNKKLFYPVSFLQQEMGVSLPVSRGGGSFLHTGEAMSQIDDDGLKNASSYVKNKTVYFTRHISCLEWLDVEALGGSCVYFWSNFLLSTVPCTELYPACMPSPG